MKIEKISIDAIKSYENNAKLHPPEQIEQIKRSILEFGNNDPIAIDENGVIIEGHGRYEALKQLGFDEIEIFRFGAAYDGQFLRHGLQCIGRRSIGIKLVDEDVRRTHYRQILLQR